jgi:ankyrin repeat protein
VNTNEEVEEDLEDEEKDKEGSDTELPLDLCETDLIELMKNLIFIVNMPGDIELGKMIEKGVNERFHLMNDCLISDSLMRQILDWFKASHSRFLHSNEVDELMTILGQDLCALQLIGATKKFVSQFEIYDIKLKLDLILKDPLQKCLHFQKEEKIFLIHGDSLFLMGLKVNQILNEHFNSVNDGYIFLSCFDLLGIWMSQNVVQAFKRTKVLAVYFNLKQVQQRKNLTKVMEKLLNSILAEEKIIFICENNDLYHYLKSILDGKNLQYHDQKILLDKTRLTDFEAQSQNNLFEKCIFMQKNCIQLKELVASSNEIKDLIESEILVQIIKDAESLDIGHEISEIDPYYITRTFNAVSFNSEIEQLNTVEQSNDSIIITSENKLQFENDTCVKENVHWISKIKCTKSSEIDKFHFHWKKTIGSVSTLREYRDNGNCCIKSLSEDELLDSKQKIIIISDPAGMGKSTLLNSLANQIKEKLPHIWVIRLDLSNYSKEFEKKIKAKLDSNTDVDFLKELMQSLPETNFKSNFENKLLTAALEETGRVVLMFDGFDEISPNYKDIVMRLIIELKKSKVDKIFLTTRPNMREELEQTLDTLSYHLKPLSNDEQFQYLWNIWSTTLNIGNDKDLQKRLEIYIKALLETMSYSISDQERELTGIPLHIKLLAEAFGEENGFSPSNDSKEIKNQELLSLTMDLPENETINETENSEKYKNATENDRQFQTCKAFLFYSGTEEQAIIPKLPERLDLVELYELFIQRKHDIFYEEKMKANKAIPSAEGEKKIGYQDFVVTHQKLALMTIFDKEALRKILPGEDLSDNIKKIQDGEERRGLVDQIIDDVPHFIHLTFAEFFIAKFFVSKIESNSKIKETYFFTLMSNFKYFLNFRAFVDSFLEKKVQNQKNYAFKVKGKQLLEDLIYLSVEEGNSNTLVSLIDHLEPKQSKKLVNSNSNEHGPFSLLGTAVQYDDVNMIKILFKHNVNLEKSNSKRQTILLRCLDKKPPHQLSSTIAELLIEQGANINTKDEQKRTPLHLAAENNYFKIVKNLINKKADVNVTDSKKETPLHYALRKNNLVIVKYLLQQNAVVNGKDNLGKTPLHKAVQNNCFETVQHLLENKAKVNAQDREGFSPLHTICNHSQNPNLNIVKHLLKYAANVNAKENGNATPLHLAVHRSHHEIVKFLLDNRADVNALDVNYYTPFLINNKSVEIVKHFEDHRSVNWLKNNNNRTELVIAIREGNLDAVKTKLQGIRNEKSKNLTEYKVGGLKVIQIAAYHGSSEICTLLKEQNFKFDNNFEFYFRGKTPFLNAIAKGDLEKCQWLQKTGANVQAKVSNHCPEFRENKIPEDQNALHITAKMNNTALSEWLIAQKLEVNVKDVNGDTPLHIAAMENYYGMCELLLQNKSFNTLVVSESDSYNHEMQNQLLQTKANVNALNKKKETPLHLAAAAGSKEISTLLLNNGAQINLVDNKGRTPLWRAFEYETEKCENEMEVSIFLLSRGAIPGKIAANEIKKIKSYKVASILKNVFADDAEIDGYDPYLKKIELMYFGATYEMENFPAYLEIEVFYSNTKKYLRAHVFFHDMHLLHCYFVLNGSVSHEDKTNLWNFIKKLKEDQWNCFQSCKKEEYILKAQIGHCFTRGKANRKTNIQYSGTNEKCLVNYTKTKRSPCVPSCHCENISKFIFAQIFQRYNQIQKKIKKHKDGKNVVVVNPDDLAIEALFHRSFEDDSEDEEDEDDDDDDEDVEEADDEDDDDDFDDQWKCSKEIKIEEQVIEFEQEETITTDIENSDLEEEESDTNVVDMEHSGI